MIQIDPDIIRQSKDGDKIAFRVIVQCMQRMVYSVALKMMCDEDDAKDVVQETFIKVWLNIKDLDECKSISTWIYTIASHVALDRLKQKRHTMPLQEDEELLRDFVTSNDTERQLENREWMALVRTIASGLSEKQRLVFTLCQLEGLSSDEVEEITGLSATQVKSNLYVARQIVRERLKKLGYEAGR